MKILGIDASSTTIALALVELNSLEEIPKLLQVASYQPKKDLSILQKLKTTKQELLNLLKDWPIPDFVYIEDIILHMQNKSTAKTITTLTALNRMVGLMVYEFYNLEPNLTSVLTIRHQIKLDKKLPKKEEIPQVLEEHFKEPFGWVFEMKGRGKNKKQQISPVSYDRSDAIAAAFAGCKLQLKAQLPKIIKKSRKSQKL